MKIVISQPMFFPWVGMFEQIKLADIYVHYVDVQFSKGSFVNRVQLKTPFGMKWLTVPLKSLSLGISIDEVEVSSLSDWRSQHLRMLTQTYAAAPFFEDMLAVVKQVYDANFKTIDEIAIKSLDTVLDYFDMNEHTHCIDSRTLNVKGRSSQRVLDILQALGGNIYITGHGAKHYLDHELFERNSIRVEYMDYQKTVYPQLHGEFTPYVSILDLIANLGKVGKSYIHSGTRYWRDCI